ncbi:MAG: glycosyltransferase family 2 protein [Phycisphaerales bacterium]
MARATLSIVMPSFNQARFLEEAIGSVLSQRDRVKEFFVLDAGSTDGSREIIEKYSEQIDWWRSEPDGGQSNAIADGFERSTGDVLTWLNSDDALLPGAVDALLDRFDSEPELGLVEGDTVVVDGDSRVMHCDRRAGPSRQWMRYGYMRIHQPSTFFRRDIYEQVGGVDRSLHCVMDTELWYRILSSTKAARLERYCGVHRIHEEAKGSADTWSEKYQAERDMIEKKYPEICGHPIRYQLGRVAYAWDRLTTGRGRKAKAETKRFAGKVIADIADQLVRC